MIARVSLLCAALAALSGCGATTVKPASDLSGAGFVQLTPNAASRAHMIANDRAFAEQVAVHRSACEKSPLCRK